MDEHDFEAKPREIGKIMRKDLGMKFKKVKQMSIHANSERNLVLRQQWTIEFLKLWTQDKVWLNVDESWLNTSDFRKMKW